MEQQEISGAPADDTEARRQRQIIEAERANGSLYHLFYHADLCESAHRVYGYLAYFGL
jgi:hypothetical protein